MFSFWTSDVVHYWICMYIYLWKFVKATFLWPLSGLWLHIFGIFDVLCHYLCVPNLINVRPWGMILIQFFSFLLNIIGIYGILLDLNEEYCTVCVFDCSFLYWMFMKYISFAFFQRVEIVFIYAGLIERIKTHFERVG